LADFIVRTVIIIWVACITLYFQNAIHKYLFKRSFLINTYIIHKVHTPLEKSSPLTHDLKSHWIWYWHGKLSNVLLISNDYLHHFLHQILWVKPHTSFFAAHAYSDLRLLQVWSCKKRLLGFSDLCDTPEKAIYAVEVIGFVSYQNYIAFWKYIAMWIMILFIHFLL